MKASSTAARPHDPAGPGSFDAVPATTLRLRSALRPSAPSSPGRRHGRGPRRSASTAANASARALLWPAAASGPRCVSAARNATCDRTAAAPFALAWDRMCRRRVGAGATPADRSRREIGGYVNRAVRHSYTSAHAAHAANTTSRRTVLSRRCDLQEGPKRPINLHLHVQVLKIASQLAQFLHIVMHRVSIINIASGNCSKKTEP